VHLRPSIWGLCNPSPQHDAIVVFQGTYDFTQTHCYCLHVGLKQLLYFLFDINETWNGRLHMHLTLPQQRSQNAHQCTEQHQSPSSKIKLLFFLYMKHSHWCINHNILGFTIACNTLLVVCFLLGNSQASEFRHRGITQKKAYNIHNTAKV
jgi:hypothetical protein